MEEELTTTKTIVSFRILRLSRVAGIVALVVEVALIKISLTVEPIQNICKLKHNNSPVCFVGHYGLFSAHNVKNLISEMMAVQSSLA